MSVASAADWHQCSEATGEVSPLEIRAMAIALFYALGTGTGGFIGPVLFGALIQTATPVNVFVATCRARCS